MKAFLATAWALVRYDYRVRFGTTFFGMLWLLVPLFALVGAAMVIGRDAGLYESGESHVYFVRLVAGLILWQLFADAWLEPKRLGRRTLNLLRSVPFDHRMLAAAGALSALVAFAIKLPVLLGALVWYQVPVTPEWLLLPLGLAAILAAGMALGCLTLPMSLVLLDVRYAAPLVQYALLLATPIFYASPSQGPVAFVNRINPFTYLVPPVRDLVTTSGHFWLVLSAAAVSVLFLLLALRYYATRMGLALAYLGR
jgi:ABC-type polysaccharide/polyol phosphate export permease